MNNEIFNKGSLINKISIYSGLYYFKKLFSITFIDCLKHFIGSQKIEELEGLKEFENIQSQYEEDEDYLKSLKYYIMNYEGIIKKKRARKPNRKGKEINEQ